MILAITLVDQIIPHTTPNINLGADVVYSWSTGETTAAIHPTPTQTTTYYLTATNGISTCEDSLTITVLPTSSLLIDSTVCDSMFFAGNYLTISDTYYDTLTNAVGCDSVVTLNLTINNSVATNDSITACDLLHGMELFIPLVEFTLRLYKLSTDAIV